MNSDFQYNLIRSKRKTISVEIQNDASILVRAPKWTPKYEIEQFLERQREWIENQQNKMVYQFLEDAWTPRLTNEELRDLTEAARIDILARIEKWAPLAAPESSWAAAQTRPRLSIRHQKTLWGSCTQEGNLSFNCLLMLAPEDVRDYVVVHELCHLKHLNHSRAFWRAVERVLPDYRKPRKWLKDNGHSLLARLQ